MPYSNGLVTVGTTPTPICSLGARGGVVIQNNGSAPVFWVVSMWRLPVSTQAFRLLPLQPFSFPRWVPTRQRCTAW